MVNPLAALMLKKPQDVRFPGLFDILCIHIDKLFSLFSSHELETLFKAADPNGNGHVSLQEGAQILGKEFPAMKSELLRTITQR